MEGHPLSPPSPRARRSALRRLLGDKAAVAATVVLALIVIACLLAPLYAHDVARTGPDAEHITETIRIGSHHRDVVSLAGIPIGPTWHRRFLLGADPKGRDVAVRLLYGGRNSLQIAAIATVITTVLAVLVGLLAGWFGGVCDLVLSRLMDLIWSYPVLLLGVALGVTLAIGGLDLGFVTLHSGSLLLPAAIIGVVYIPYAARPLRGQVLELRSREFVDAARQQGLRGARIMAAEILPNLASSILAFVPLLLANAILLEAGLSFLGAGVQPPAPSWGTMIAEGTRLMPAAIHIVLAPGLMMLVTVVCANVLGDSARDALDPRRSGAARRRRGRLREASRGLGAGAGTGMGTSTDAGASVGAAVAERLRGGSA